MLSLLFSELLHRPFYRAEGCVNIEQFRRAMNIWLGKYLKEPTRVKQKIKGLSSVIVRQNTAQASSGITKKVQVQVQCLHHKHVYLVSRCTANWSKKIVYTSNNKIPYRSTQTVLNYNRTSQARCVHSL